MGSLAGLPLPALQSRAGSFRVGESCRCGVDLAGLSCRASVGSATILPGICLLLLVLLDKH